MILPRPAQVLLAVTPLPAVALAANRLLQSVVVRHPRLFDRLGDYASRSFCIAPTDTPFEFLLRPAERKVEVRRPGRFLRSDARIAGPLVLLLALAEGRLDGDAEFFGRQLIIDGDMEAVLALRNAMENEDLDFTRDFAPARGPLRRPAEAVLSTLRRVLLSRETSQWN
jgi:predicted lipid carrier protein YhbT